MFYNPTSLGARTGIICHPILASALGDFWRSSFLCCSGMSTWTRTTETRTTTTGPSTSRKVILGQMGVSANLQTKPCLHLRSYWNHAYSQHVVSRFGDLNYGALEAFRCYLSVCICSVESNPNGIKILLSLWCSNSIRITVRTKKPWPIKINCVDHVNTLWDIEDRCHVSRRASCESAPVFWDLN